MMNKEKTLFIFEGVKTESKLIEKLEHNFLGKTNSIKCVFDAEIYQLYRAIKEEKEFSIDIVSLLKERTAENAKILENYTRDSFAYIYLFFDYDAHSTLADDNKIKEMLSLFNDETEEGMLYISYPMVEAIRHFKDLESFKSLTVKCKRKNCPYKEECHNKEECLKEPHYKSVAASDSRPQLSNVNSYTKTVWQELIGVATSEKDGLMPSIQRMTTSYQKDQQKYCKIAEFRNRLTGISMLISVFKNHENSSPSVVLLTGYSDDLSVNSIKRGIYLTNVYYQKKENKTIVYVKSSAYVYISTLCIGMNGSLKLSHENNLDLPSDAIEIPIS